MKVKTIKSLLGMLAIFAFLFAGCDDGGSSGTSGTATQQEQKNDDSTKTSDESKDDSDDSKDSPTEADVTNATVRIVKGEGWLNSAYIIFDQIDGATYKVLCDDTQIDEPLIRYYDTYTYYESSEDANLQVTWTKKTLSKVVRADALGLAAGEHTMKVCAISGDTTSDYSSAKMTVVDHDRSGFAFAPSATTTPGAYKADGTLKDNAIVLYVTGATAKTVSYTQVKGTNATADATYTGLQDILSESSLKKLTVPLDIRIIGTIKLSEMDSIASSDEGLQIKTTTDCGITVEGVGHDAAVYGFGFLIRKANYVEVANLGVFNFIDDGISVDTDNSYLWIHNNDISYGAVGSDSDQAKGDGSLDFKKSTYSSLAYNHFWDSGKCNLLDASASSSGGSNYLSYHHNWYDHSDSRHPRIRNATAVHVYNNYYDGNAKYGVGVTSGSSAFVEGNYFRNANDPMMSSLQGTDAQGSGTFSGEEGGSIKAYNNFYTGNSNYASDGGSTSTSGMKLHYITNKYDYTNGVAVTEPETHTKTVGTKNADGTWTIYDWVRGDTSAFITLGSGATDNKDGGKAVQISAKKTDAMSFKVPASTTKVIINARCGSSNAASTTLKVNGESQTVGTTYADYTFSVSLSSDTILTISSGDAALNIHGITVIASSAWTTTYTTGISLSDIDAYEVDSRSATVPETVTTKSGSHTYSNFDTTLGLAGLGLADVPSSPKTAKTEVMKYAGRHDADFAFTFTNATEDTNYGVIAELKAAVVAYTSSLTAVQGMKTASDDSSTDTDADSEKTDDTQKDTETDTENLPTGSAVVSLVSNNDVSPSDARVTCTSCSVNLKESNGSVTIEYNGETYSTIKMESKSKITVTAKAGATITVVGSLPSGKQSCFKWNGEAQKLDAKTTAVTTFTRSVTATGNDVIEKGDTASIGVIVISE